MTQTGPIAVRPPGERPGSARAVVVIGAGPVGLPAIGEQQAQAAIRYRMPDVLGSEREPFANRRVAVLGAGHSAVGTILDLVALREAEPDTSILWLVRGSDTQRAFGGGDKDQIAARGTIGTRFRHLVEGGKIGIESGFRVSRLNSRRSSLAPLIDPNVHSCWTVRPHGARELAHPEAGFYIAGMESYGRAPTFLMITGYEQVRSFVAELAGDSEAAAKVELVLPETGSAQRRSMQSMRQGAVSPRPRRRRRDAARRQPPPTKRNAAARWRALANDNGISQQ